MAEPFLEKNLHPTVITRAYTQALEDCIKIIDQASFPIDTNNKARRRHKRGNRDHTLGPNAADWAEPPLTAMALPTYRTGGDAEHYQLVHWYQVYAPFRVPDG